MKIDNLRTHWREAGQLFEMYCIAFFGGWIAHLLKFPAEWLTGALIFVALALFTGRSYHMPKWVHEAGFALIGIILGSGFSPDIFRAIATWPISLAFLCLTIITISWSAYSVLRRIGRWDHATALFASLPGALSYVIAIAEAAKADMQRVAIAQSIRLFVMLALLPMILTPFSEKHASRLMELETPLTSQASLWWGYLLVMIIVTAGLVPVVRRLRIPAGILLASMTVSGSFYFSGIFNAPLPDWLTIFGFVTLGAMVGCRFGSISAETLLKLSGISLLSLSISVSISVLFAFLCANVLTLPIGQVFLAFAPGGLEAMVLLAFIFDLNPAYVAGHHLVRYLGLVFLAPLVTNRLTRNQQQK